MTTIKRITVGFLLFLIKIYQKCLSPLWPPTCRFYPTCSGYAAEALKIHGLWPGLWLVVRRLSRCHPWHPGGYDPVPARPGDSVHFSNQA